MGVETPRFQRQSHRAYRAACRFSFRTPFTSRTQGGGKDGIVLSSINGSTVCLDGAQHLSSRPVLWRVIEVGFLFSFRAADLTLARSPRVRQGGPYPCVSYTLGSPELPSPIIIEHPCRKSDTILCLSDFDHFFVRSEPASTAHRYRPGLSVTRRLHDLTRPPNAIWATSSSFPRGMR